MPYSEHGSVGNVVFCLLTGGDAQNKGYVLVMDRYYNSVTLFNHLHTVEKTYAVGTAMTDWKHFPNEMKKKKMRTHVETFMCCGHITAMVLSDKKSVHFFI